MGVSGWVCMIAQFSNANCTSICMSSKSVSQILKILFQTRNINIFILRDVFFFPFPTKETSAVKSKIHFNREAIGN